VENKKKKMNNQLTEVLKESYREAKTGFPYKNIKDVTFVEVKNIMPYGKELAVFNGFENNANVSFFLVDFSPGVGPQKHRHPYEETFIVLEGEMEAIVDGKTYIVKEGNIMVVPAGKWHEFTNKTDKKLKTVNIHPVAVMDTEWYSAQPE
jgi:quercetin dioxygenase-like cupin family protein